MDTYPDEITPSMRPEMFVLQNIILILTYKVNIANLSAQGDCIISVFRWPVPKMV
jgi:hypothetical protein